MFQSPSPPSPGRCRVVPCRAPGVSSAETPRPDAQRQLPSADGCGSGGGDSRTVQAPARPLASGGGRTLIPKSHLAWVPPRRHTPLPSRPSPFLLRARNRGPPVQALPLRSLECGGPFCPVALALTALQPPALRPPPRRRLSTLCPPDAILCHSLCPVPVLHCVLHGTPATGPSGTCALFSGRCVCGSSAVIVTSCLYVSHGTRSS